MKLSNSLKDDDTFVLVGKITGAHGLKGVVRVSPFAESFLVFSADKKILLETPDGKRLNRKIIWGRPHGQVIRLQLDQVTDRDQAKQLAGTLLFVEKSDLPAPEEGTYYWFDLIGMSVYTPDNQCIGTIDSIIPTGSNDVFVVKGSGNDGETEILIPALESVVMDIDMEKGIMRVELPEGL